MLSVHQHWDPLKVCAVGRSYPPEFYSFVKNSKARSVLERIAIETEEDYQKLISLLESFGITIVRNDISDNIEDHFWCGHYSPPPMTPRDHTAMIGNKFFMPGSNYGEWPFNYVTNFMEEFNDIFDARDSGKKLTVQQKENISRSIRNKIESYDCDSHVRNAILTTLRSLVRSINTNPLSTFPNNKKFNTFSTIEKFLKDSGNEIIYDTYINAATLSRIGKDLYFGTVGDWLVEDQISSDYLQYAEKYFSKDYRIHKVDSASHSDAVFTPVKPGLIVTLEDRVSFDKTFPGWEVVRLPGQSWAKVDSFLQLKEKNQGKWWVPGEELNDDFTDFVETWLRDWVLYVEETVFDVNMLVIDEKNVVCNNYNKKVFDAFERHGITPHVVNFRHRYFWDGGLHCITTDLHREGTMKDYFPERTKGDCI